ncbi:nuclear factor, interleukin 3 regulated, member 6 [Carcharodon carcharias]|uniref:nuclear factor, interleukin 3 regulated, member 6 n=1 Tax=Carcharodon carcharias TaxID=13397 RepID=UPI001B7EA607|nr:nuclear factor, interleukin 3 regulated, member 6 [Carcharodon carcharias]XP_041033355.1 nuclear factor, interleukin 3 regulated, member 6 [Carcharodon carcharias]XP_041033356.1 nuclear factor, interleukin 3 regulated, member 6 [Carcharodon carcharias]XP_041033357.1 nuclear factor, interleukin 3 regulated, member 6 [Carcharodon carcharias]
MSVVESFQEVGEPKTDHLQGVTQPPRTLDLCAPHLSFTDEAVSLLTTNNLLARSLLGARQIKHKGTNSMSRRKREFIPDEKKDNSYWDKRKKNNEAAKRSREKRRVNDMVLEQRVIALLEENARLKAELLALKFRFGLIKDPSEAPSVQNNPQPLRCITGIQPAFLPRPDNGYVMQPVDNKSLPPRNQQFRAELGVEQESCMVSEDSGISTPGSSNVGSPVFFDDHLSDQDKFSPNHEDHFESQLSSNSDAEVDIGRMYPSENMKPTRSLELTEMVKSLPHKLRFKIGAGVEESAEVDVKVKVVQMAMGNFGRGSPEQPVGQIREQQHGCYTNTLMPQADRGVSAGLVPPAWRAHTGHLPDESKSGLNYRCMQDSVHLSAQGAPGYPKDTLKEDSTYKSENNVLKNQLASLSAEVAQLKKMFSQQMYSNLN